MLEDLEAHLATRDDALTMREVGVLVSRAFAEDRKKMSTVIEEALARVRSEPRSGVMPTFESQFSTGAGSEPRSANMPSAVSAQIAIGPGSESSISLARIGSLAALQSISPSAFAPSAAPLSAMLPAPMRGGWGAKRTAIAITAACVFVGASVVVATALTSTPVKPLATLAAEAPPRVAPAPVREEPEVVDLVVRVTPASAQISIDGVVVATNPFHGRYQKDGQIHHVMLSADGYDTKVDDVAFSGDVSVDVSLDRNAKARATVAPPAPPPPQPPPAPVHLVRGRFVPVAPVHTADSAPAPVAAASPSTRASAPPPPTAAAPDLSPTGGRPPLHSIATNNPYGTP